MIWEQDAKKNYRVVIPQICSPKNKNKIFGRYLVYNLITHNLLNFDAKILRDWYRIEREYIEKKWLNGKNECGRSETFSFGSGSKFVSVWRWQFLIHNPLFYVLVFLILPINMFNVNSYSGSSLKAVQISTFIFDNLVTFATKYKSPMCFLHS